MRHRLPALLPAARRLCSGAHAPVALHAVTIAPRAPPSASPPPPPVLVLHGVLASEATYRSLLNRPDFAPEREKIAVDLRNHGRSPHVTRPGAMSYDHMLADVVQLLRERGVERAAVVGHSMGGKLGMHLALSHPRLVSQLVVVDIAPVRYGAARDGADALSVARAMLRADVAAAPSRAHVRRRLAEHGVACDAVRSFVMTNLARAAGDGGARFRWKPNVRAIHAALPLIMSFPPQGQRRYDGRTCVIRGGDSKYVPFQAMRAVTRLFPNTKLVTIAGAGHWLPSQMPQQFCAAVNDFLR